jgi:MFS family permease
MIARIYRGITLDLLSIFLYVLLAVVAGFIIYGLTGDRREKQKAKNAEIKKAKLEGTYRTNKAGKIGAFFGGLFLYLYFALLFTFSTSWVAVGLVIGLFVGILFSVLAVFIGSVAEEKGRSFAAFFFLSLLISPIIMGIIVATISPMKNSSGDTKPEIGFEQPASKDLAQEIEKLGQLREKGLITKAEFDAKKKELLDRI